MLYNGMQYNGRYDAGLQQHLQGEAVHGLDRVSACRAATHHIELVVVYSNDHRKH